MRFDIRHFFVTVALLVLACCGQVRETQDGWRIAVRPVIKESLAEGHFDSLVLSPDGKHISYDFATTEGIRLMLDGKTMATFGGEPDYKLFSRDGKHFAYRVSSGTPKKRLWIVDGKPHHWYEDTEVAAFTEDGQQFSYVALDNRKMFVVINGVAEGKHYDRFFQKLLYDYPQPRRIPRLERSLDGHVLYGAYFQDRTYLVTDGREINVPGLQDWEHSPDWSQIAYQVTTTSGSFVVTNGRKDRAYSSVEMLTFSPDSHRFAYTAKGADNKAHVVIDGTEQKAYDSAGRLSFSPDSKRFAYVATVDNKSFVVMDGTEQKPYDFRAGLGGVEVGYLTFSPDSKRFAYTAWVDNKSFVVIDGIEQKAYDSVGELVFSPNGKRFAYVARHESTAFVVLDNKEEDKFDTITVPPAFTPSSHSVIYAVGHLRESPQTLQVIIDGQASSRYVEIIDPLTMKESEILGPYASPYFPVHFTSPDSLSFLALSPKPYRYYWLDVSRASRR